MYSLEKTNIFNEFNIDLNSINSVTFYNKFINREIVKDILEFSSQFPENETKVINIFFEKNINNFLYGYSEFSSITMLDQLDNFSLNGVNKINSNFCLIDESFLIVQNEGSFIKNITQSPVSFYNVSDSVKNVNLINESIIEYNQSNHFDIDEFLNNYIKTLHIYLSDSTNNLINFPNDQNLIDSKLIPQFSNLDDATYKLVDVLTQSGNLGVSFDSLGLYLTEQGKKKGAYKKYGENHSKLAELLDLVLISNESPRKIYLTKLGELFYSLDDKQKKELIIFQILRMDIVKDIIVQSNNPDFNLLNYLKLFLAPSTATRRESNIKSIFRFLVQNNISLPEQLLKNL